MRFEVGDIVRISRKRLSEISVDATRRLLSNEGKVVRINADDYDTYVVVDFPNYGTVHYFPKNVRLVRRES